MVDISKLSGTIPDKVFKSLTPDFLNKSGIDGKVRFSHFIGQTQEETGNYSRAVENLNYSGDALWKLFHTHFKDLAEANTYARQPERIANRIYANRMGNGNESSGDGWKYRGRGDLQLTGKNAYAMFQDWVNGGSTVKVDFINNPDLVAATPYDLLSASWFFTLNKIWAICDKGVDMATVTAVTKKVNGDTINLQTRFDYTNRIYKILSA